MRTRFLIATVLAAGLLLSGCTGTPPSKSANADQTFTYANNLTVMTDWDPATSYSNEVIAMSNMYEQLTRYDSRTGKVEPLLATSWRSADHGRTWTFTLRKGVRFTTGRPVTAAAAKAALDRTRRLKEGAAYEWASVHTITAPDPTTLVFHLSYAAPIDLIASSAYAAYIYDTKATTGNLHQWFEAGHAAGTGPYRVETWNKGQEDELTLEKNPHYWGGWKGRHYTQVDFLDVPEETTAAQLVQSGQASFVPRLSPSLFNSLERNTRVHTAQRPSFQNIMAMLNTASGPLANQSLRVAVSEAIDYQGIVSALKGSVVRANGVIPRGLLGFSTAVHQTTDVAAAKRILAAHGYSPSHPLTLTLTYASGTPELDTIVALLKSNLAAVGVNLQTKALAWETQWALAKSSDLSKRQDIFLFYWYPDYADPFSWFISLFRSAKQVSFNLSYWHDARADATIDRLQALTATDRPAAARAYVRLQQLISRDAVAPVLGVDEFQRVLASTVDGYVDNPAYSNVVFVHDLTPAF